MTHHITFPLRGDHITLDALLKATGLAPSGGIAKMRVGNGEVQVDGVIELRKTCKIRADQVVTVDDTDIHVAQATTSKP
jgi:ribosome-associated protein